MQELMGLLTAYGLALVFINVFLVQAGAPVPAVPTLMVAGALATTGAMSLTAIVAVAAVASVLGDLIWYFLGRNYGMRILKMLCRISISPDSCVRQTEDRFVKWGVLSLIFAKFIPGFATVAPPLAGALRIKLRSFLFYSAISATLWAGLAAGAGMMFSREIEWVIERLQRMGGYALMLLGIALALFIAFKWWERRRFYLALRMARISVDDLYRLIEEGAEPIVLDVRSASARSIDPRRIPGALAVDIDRLDNVLSELPSEREIILYCACPNEASAARVARMLIDRGLKRVRPLEGGLDAWIDAGYRDAQFD